MERNNRNNNRYIPDTDRVITRSNRGSEDVQLLEFMTTALPDTPRTRLKSMLKYGHIRMAGVDKPRHDTPVPPGAEVQINLARPFITFSHPRMQLVYEDDDVIVINKGYGLLSMGTPSAKRDVTAYSVLKEYVKRVNPLNKIFIVHRLDRDTSGLMMFAKTQEAKEAMQHNWNNMVLERNYVAVVEGIMEEDSGVVRSYLDQTREYEVYSTKEPGKGQLAVTRYKVLARGGGYSLVEFSLDTGRKNQIRVHAHDLGHPIVGDRKYGAIASPIHRLALHARTLRFVHPRTRKDMRFELPVPSRFNALIKKGNPSSSTEQNPLLNKF
ncbi:MAG: RluA family pseudouridine synthase [Muribaculaceae bacterium]|nr:RluA family pseudouridine synthase [Muribaculaceae bacterium]